jgi:outer membrane receptor protein involved in Fe transport
MKRFLPVLALLFISFSLIAQRPHGHGPGGMGPGMMPNSGIMGRVIDASTKQPVEYANVALFNAEDSILVNGGITNDKGFFMIKKVAPGIYNMRIKFIGYKSHTVNKIEVTEENPLVRFRGVEIHPVSVELDGVTVTAKQEEVVYKIDKRVVNVSENINTVGGTAVDALENTPGIEVDIDGNVSIRGSDNFTVLIDGKPTAMSGNDALQQIPASSIKEIEIITNPSAKYDPDGLTGILNIILKKDEKGGFNGQVSATVGTADQYNAGANLNYRKDKLSLTGGYDFRQGGRRGNSESFYKTYNDDRDSIYYRDEDGDRGHQRINHSINAGIDYDFNDFNFLSVTGRVRVGERNRGNESFYHSYTSFDLTDIDFFTKGENEDDETSYEISSTYIHRFSEEEHEIKIMANYSAEDALESAYTLNDTLGINEIVEESLTETTEKHQHGTFQIDYTLPLGSRKLEAGMKSSLRGITYDQTGDIIDPIPGSLSNEFVYNEGIHAAYVMFSGPLGGLEYQLGLRGEYSKVETEQKSLNEKNIKEIFTVYPTLHFSYEINKKNKLMAGYSRRVHRPRTYFLNPYEERSDAFTVRKGNPDLDPEYAHSIELNYLKYFENSFLNFTTFYRQTDNNIGRVQQVIENITYLSFDNINKESSLGIEVSARHKFKKWVSLNASYSFFRYTIDGEVYGEDLSNESMNHKIRGNADIKIGRNIRISAFGMYFSPSATSQGEREAFYFTGFGYKHTFFDQKLTLSARVRNPFGNFQWRFTSRGSNFENEFIRRPDFPQFNVGLTYRFGEASKKRKMGREEGGTREDFNDGMTVD